MACSGKISGICAETREVQKSMSNMDTPLARPIMIGKRHCDNRFVINAMECCDADGSGNISQSAFDRYRNFCEGGASLIIFESFTVQYDSVARKHQLGITEQNVEMLKKTIAALKAINSKPLLVIQLNHAGEISDNAFSRRITVKQRYGFEGELVDAQYIDNVIEDFVKASKILYDIGADGVDLKFCHGYLASQILRPYNDRDWKYGGSWENRRSFAFTMMEKVRKAIPDENFLVGSKISMWEGFPGGMGCAGPDTPVMDLTESIDLCRGLSERGANFLIQSNGSTKTTKSMHMPASYKPDDAYLQFTLTKVVRDNVLPETVVVGSAYSALNSGNNILRGVAPENKSLFAFGNNNIEHGFTDMVAIGRQALADPYLPIKYLEGREDEIKWCIACNKCLELLHRQQAVGCIVQDKKFAEILKEARLNSTVKLPQIP